MKSLILSYGDDYRGSEFNLYPLASARRSIRLYSGYRLNFFCLNPASQPLNKRPCIKLKVDISLFGVKIEKEYLNIIFCCQKNQDLKLTTRTAILPITILPICVMLPIPKTCKIRGSKIESLPVNIKEFPGANNVPNGNPTSNITENLFISVAQKQNLKRQKNTTEKPVNFSENFQNVTSRRIQPFIRNKEPTNRRLRDLPTFYRAPTWKSSNLEIDKAIAHFSSFPYIQGREESWDSGEKKKTGLGPEPHTVFGRAY